MAHTASAKKRIKQYERNRIANRVRKSQVRTALRKLEECLAAGKKDEAKKLVPGVQKLIDQAVSRGAYPKNTGARLKSRLMTRTTATATATKS